MADFYNYNSSSLISGTSGNDYIYNDGDDVTINGDLGDDTINNGDNKGGGWWVSIDGSFGDDNIYNYGYEDGNGKYVTLNGSYGSDFIYNQGDYSILIGAEGADELRNWHGNNATLNGGAGNDTLRNYYGNEDFLIGGTGDDLISLSVNATNNLISYSPGDGNDTIYGFDDNDTLSIGGGSYSTTESGDDIILTVDDGRITLVGASGKTINIEGATFLNVINNTDSSVKLYAVKGEDSIKNYGNKVTVVGASDIDSVWNFGENVSINGSGGNDHLDNRGNKVTMLGGDGNDLLRNDTWNDGANTVKMDGGSGDDKLTNFGDKVTMLGGEGDDYLHNDRNGGGGVNVSMDSGAGNDNILNFGTDSTIKGGTGNDTISNLAKGYINGELKFDDGGSNVVISGGDGKDSIRNTGDNVTIKGDAGNDFIHSGYYDDTTYFGGANVKIYGGTGSDTILNDDGGDTVSIDSGDGNDSISNKGSFATINAGIGNDTILSGYNSSINGGAGDDLISLHSDSGINYVVDGTAYTGKGNIVFGGKGNDTIYGNGSSDYVALYKYTSGDGNDIIYNFTSYDTLQIGDGKGTYSSIKSGKNIIVTVSDGKISLIGAASLSTINIKGKEIVPNKNKWTIDGTTAKYGTSSKTLITVKGLKSGLKVSSGKISGISLSGKVVTLSESVLDTSKVTISGDGYTLALGDDVSAPSSKKAAWTLSGSTATYKGSYKTAGYKLASNSKSISYTKATTAESLATVKGASLTSGLSVSGKKITLKKSALKNKVTIGGGYEFNFASDYKNATITGSAKADSITANGTKLSINGGKGNDTIKVLGNSNTVKGGEGSDLFIYKAGKSGVISDYAAEDMISIMSGTAEFTTSGNDVILTAGNGKITVKGGKDKTITYTDTKGEHVYPNDEKIITLNEDYDKETYTMGSKLRTLDASAVPLDIKITGNNLMNSIIGGEGNDTLIGGGSNDTLTGGKGSDVFVWNKGDGNDLITDYTEEDKILIKGDSVKGFTANSDDIIFNLASGNKLSIIGGAYEVISYTDAKYKDGRNYSHYVNFNSEGTSATLKSSYSKSSFTASNYANLEAIDASKVARGMNIVGNSVANSITGTTDEDIIDGGANNDTIYGRDGNDSLFGGKGKDYLYGGEGNDTLWGGTGNDFLYGGGKKDKDIFVFGNDDGNNTIFDYEQSIDKIMILSGKQPVLASTPLDNDVTFNIGNGKITVVDGAHKTITFVDSKGKNLEHYVPE